MARNCFAHSARTGRKSSFRRVRSSSAIKWKLHPDGAGRAANPDNSASCGGLGKPTQQVDAAARRFAVYREMIAEETANPPNQRSRHHD